MVVRSLAPTLEARNIHHYLFFVKGGQTCQKSEKKQRTNTTANSFVFAPFRVRRSGHQQQRATFGLNLKGGWRPFQPRKKKRFEEEHHYYYVTRGQERDAASTHNKKKKKKVSLLPTHQTRKKEELVNKRIVVVAVLSCEKTFRSSFVPKKIISRRRRINAREKDEQ